MNLVIPDDIFVASEMSEADLKLEIAIVLYKREKISVGKACEWLTAGKLRPELRTIAVVSRVSTGNLDPNTDFALTADWGYAGQNGVTMPGKGKVSDRAYLPEELSIGRGVAFGQNATDLSINPEPNAAPLRELGHTTHNIYLNDIAYWKNIPDRVALHDRWVSGDQKMVELSRAGIIGASIETRRSHRSYPNGTTHCSYFAART
jgi:hypothetical protein